MPPDIAARIAAGQELRRRGKLSAAQNAALRELEQRYAEPAVNSAMAAGDTATARVIAEDREAANKVRNPQRVRLSPVEEPSFRKWYGEWAKKAGLDPDPDNPLHKYDYRAAFKAKAVPKVDAGDGLLHWPSEFKDDDHPNRFVGGKDTKQSGTTKPTPKPSHREAGRTEFTASGHGALSAFNQGMGSGAFGAGTPVSAVTEMGVSMVRGEPRNYEESREFVRGRQEQAYKDHPNTYRAGYITGAVLSGGAIKSAVKATLPKVASVFTLEAAKTGERLHKMAVARNAFRLGGIGGAAAGVTAGNQEGLDAAPFAAGLGAVIGPVAGPVVVGAANLARGLAGVFRISPKNAAIRALSKRYKESAATIAGLYDDFVKETGRKPGLNEIVSRIEAGRVGQIGTQFPAAGQVLREAEEVASAARPTELRAVVERGGPTGTAKALVKARNKAFKHTLSQIGEHRVILDREIQDVIEDIEVQNALPPILRRRINQVLDEGGDIGSIEMTVNEFDMMRQAVNNKIGRGGGQLYKDYRNKLRGYITDRIPEYGEALEKYGRYSEAIKGAQVGQRVLTNDADQFKAAVAEAADNAGGMEGLAPSARSKVANRAGDSPESAVATARALTHPGLQQRLQDALGAPEAARLQRVGTLTSNAARNLREAAPDTGPAQQEAAERAQKVYNAITGAVALSGTASGALKAHLAQRISQRIGLGEKAARLLAEFASDPAKAPEAIRRLQKAGVSPDELARWYQDAAVAAGIVVGTAQ